MAEQGERPEPLRVGVIGCGAGMFHLEAYSNDPRVQIVALAGLDTDRCQALSAKYNVPNVYREYQDLLANDDIDAVSIAVPNFLHKPVAIAALEAGKHVLVEKPLARNAEEGAAMVAAAEKADKVLAVSFQRRGRHDVQLMREAVQSGSLGNIYYSKAFWMRRNGVPGWGSWFTSKEAAGGGPLIDLGVHVLDLLLYVLGNPRIASVTGTTYNQLGTQGKGNWVSASRSGEAGRNADTTKQYEVEDLAAAFVRFEDGGTLVCEASWASYGEMEDDFGIQVYGSNGGARLHSVKYSDTDTLRLWTDIGNTTQESAPVIVPLLGFGHVGVTRNFVDAILNGTPMSPDGNEGLDRVRLIDAIYRSAELGREIRFVDGVAVED